MNAIRSGMDLLRCQDFASRLRKVGQKDADEVVALYNSVMSNMKAERLKNLEQDSFLSKLIEASPMGIAICKLDGSIETKNGFQGSRKPRTDGGSCHSACRRTDHGAYRRHSGIALHKAFLYGSRFP